MSDALTVEACARCGDSYCERCPMCDACSSSRCTCEPPTSTATGREANCEGCGGKVHAGDLIRLYADDIVAHDACPTSTGARA